MFAIKPKWILLETLLVALPALTYAQRLPPRPENPRALEFTGPEAGWPPQVKGATNIKILPAEQSPSGLTTERVDRLRAAAIAAPAVKRSLGDRFAFIGAALVENSKQDDQLPIDQRVVNLTFFSYSRNVAVRTLMRKAVVSDVTDIEGYQPAESPEEIDRAVRLAREDPRIRDSVRELEGRALLTGTGEAALGSGHRVLYVSFLRQNSARTEVMALVDLNDNRVLQAGRPSGQ